MDSDLDREIRETEIRLAGLRARRSAGVEQPDGGGPAADRWRDLDSSLMLKGASICYLAGSTHVYALANANYRQLIGGRDPIGQTIRAVLPELDGQGFFELLDRVYATGEPFIGVEMPVRLTRREDGAFEDSYFNVVLQPTRDAAGAVDGIFVQTFEVTGQMRARLRVEALYHEVQEAELRYRKLFEGVGEAILVTDDAGNYLDANPAAVALTGYRVEELRELRVGALTADNSEFAQHIHQLPDGSVSGELTIRRKDGSTVPVEGWVTSVDLPTGRLHLGTWRDISERLARQQTQQDFLAMVAHDLRTPLTAMKGYIDLMQRRAVYNAGYVATIAMQAERMSRLIADVLEVSRLDANRLVLRRTATDLVSLLQTCVAETGQLDGDHPITLVAPDGPLVGEWDPDRVYQVVQNLLMNAVKYSAAGEAIEVRAVGAGDTACVSITDHGVGVPPEALPHLFDRFYRADNVIGSGAKGLGLGLYICKGLIEAHGGTLWAESVLGAGSTFTFTLPYQAPATSP